MCYPEDPPWRVTTRPPARPTIAAVTREQAIERIRKLQAVTVQRGATEHEAAAAAERAARLAARFGLSPALAPAHAPGRTATQTYAKGARTDRRTPGSLRFVRFA
jgi:hypothetical protein